MPLFTVTCDGRYHSRSAPPLPYVVQPLGLVAQGKQVVHTLGFGLPLTEVPVKLESKTSFHDGGRALAEAGASRANMVTDATAATARTPDKTVRSRRGRRPSPERADPWGRDVRDSNIAFHARVGSETHRQAGSGQCCQADGCHTLTDLMIIVPVQLPGLVLSSATFAMKYISCCGTSLVAVNILVLS